MRLDEQGNVETTGWHILDEADIPELTEAIAAHKTIFPHYWEG